MTLRLAIAALLLVACAPEPAPAGGCPVPYPAHGSYLVGTCVLSCAVGYEDCNGEVSDGCEVTLRTQTDCGTCGDSCSRLPGSTCRLARPGLSTAYSCVSP